MTASEHNHYNRITKNMEADFLILTDKFMGWCEDIIFGSDVPEIKYYCFHLYNDPYTRNIFSRLSFRIEKLLQKTDPEYYPNLFDGFSNLLIYLKEPIARENDSDYKAEIYAYWLGVIREDPELVKMSSAFRKYFTAI